MAMHLTIISPTEQLTYKIAWLEINTPVGNFVILPDHAPTVVELSQNQPLTFGLKNGKQESLIIPRGIVEISRNSALVLMHE